MIASNRISKSARANISLCTNEWQWFHAALLLHTELCYTIQRYCILVTVAIRNELFILIEMQYSPVHFLDIWIFDYGMVSAHALLILCVWSTRVARSHAIFVFSILFIIPLVIKIYFTINNGSSIIRCCHCLSTNSKQLITSSIKQIWRADTDAPGRCLNDSHWIGRITLETLSNKWQTADWTKTQLFSFEILYWHNYSFQFRNRNFIRQIYWYVCLHIWSQTNQIRSFLILSTDWL